MTPNLYVFLRTAVDPRLWHRSQRICSASFQPTPPEATTEHWDRPIPGTYQYKQGCGWYLVARDSAPGRTLTRPDLVVWSEALNRPILASEYAERQVEAPLPEDANAEMTHKDSLGSIYSVGTDSGYASSVRGSRSRASSTTAQDPARKRSSNAPAARANQKSPQLVSFIRLDDGVTYVNDRDAQGQPTKGPWQRFVVDADTGRLRPMRKKDDPSRRSAGSSLAPSAVASPAMSTANSPRSSTHDLRICSVDKRLDVPRIHAAVAKVAKEKMMAEQAAMAVEQHAR